MKKQDDNLLLKGIALLGGGYMFVELLKMFAKPTTFYDCPRCHYDQITFAQKSCPNCKSNLKWPDQTN